MGKLVTVFIGEVNEFLNKFLSSIKINIFTKFTFVSKIIFLKFTFSSSEN